MAEQVQEAPQEAEPKRPAGRMKLILIAVAGLVLCLGLCGGAVWWFGWLGGSAAAEQAASPEAGSGSSQAAAGEGEGGEASPGEGGAHGANVAFVDLPDVVVNLQSPGPRMRFLKLRMSLETAGDWEAEQVRLLTPRILDSFQLYLRALTVEDVQGVVGMQRLKEEMLLRLHVAIDPLQVADILIKEMLVQ